MDNDPPPSYNSVVKDQLRTRDQAAGNPDENQRLGQRDQEGRELIEPATVVNNNIEAPDNCARDNCNNNNIGDNIPNAGREEPQVEQQRSSGLWNRFKKGLEDLALFVIQVLD